MRVYNETLPVITMTSTQSSATIQSAHIGYLTVAAIYTGAPVGSLKLQCSLDTGTNWIDIPGMVQAISAAGSNIFEMKEFGYPLIKAVYTFTSGTGTLTLQANGKGF